MRRFIWLFVCAAAIVQIAAFTAGFCQSEIYKDFRWRSIGPANMAGRVSDIDAVENDFKTVYVAAASGGVWKSTNAGIAWTPVFDSYGAASIGDVTICQKDPNIVWVGTGEACVRNSVAWGDGIYKSTDGGKTFVNMGLRYSHHIGEIAVHPTDPDIVYAAAQGHLWDYTGERGLYKTIDGGKTWTKVTNGLPDDGKTGCTDVKIDPKNPNIMYCAFWQRLRQPHRFDSGGPNGGIFKSTDSGKSWKKLTKGLPAGDTGKIDISIYRKNPSIVMTIIEHGFQPPRNSPDYADMTKLGTGIYRSEDGGSSWKLLNRSNDRPFYYSHLYINPSDDKLVYYLAANAGISEDGGKTFARSMPGIAGDFHALWTDPNNKDRFYTGDDKGAYLTYDGGKTFIMFDNMAIGQFYAVTADNRDPYWVYGGLQDNGCWGGPSNSRDYNGILNDHWFKFHSGDGFHTTVDPDDWRTVYTESQGGSINRYDAVFHQYGKSIKPRPSTIINFGEYFPNYTGNMNSLPRDFRFNWSSPLYLSPHNSNIVFFGGNYLFKSIDKGENWRIISPDLSTNIPEKAYPEGNGGLTSENSGAETHCTLITISESPVVPGVIWAGTDDGNVQITLNDGQSWTNVRDNIADVPKGLWCSRVEASRFTAGTAYVSFDGHRSDNFKPYIVKTTDYGETWVNITSNLPENQPVYVIKEDLKNSNLLFVGTEFAAFVSLDGGKHWERLMNDMPTVAVHDLVIHPREGDLIAATHGRSIWILDDITPLQQTTPEVLNSDAYLFEPKTATIWRAISRGAERGHMLFMGRNPLTIQQREPSNSPSELQNSATIHYYLKAKPANPVKLEIADITGTKTFSAAFPGEPGINRYYWNLRLSSPVQEQSQTRPARGLGAPQAEAGIYKITLTVDGKTMTRFLIVRDDPGLDEIK